MNNLYRRDQTVRDLINSYDVYEDLMAKSQKGLEFYKKLETNVRRLLARCMGVCKVQQEEREQITNRYKPKGKVSLAYQIRIPACCTWTDNSYLTHVISPRTG